MEEEKNGKVFLNKDNKIKVEIEKKNKMKIQYLIQIKWRKHLC